MLANKSSSVADKTAASEIAIDLPLKIRIYKNAWIEQVLRSPFVPASEDPGNTGVATRDVVIDQEAGVAARLFLPTGAVATGRRLPLVLFFHGGSFAAGAAESAFCRTYHRYATSLAARARALVVSVEYRLVPEHPVTAAYDDAWTALRWAASSADPWLLYHADARRIFITVATSPTARPYAPAGMARTSTSTSTSRGYFSSIPTSGNPSGRLQKMPAMVAGFSPRRRWPRPRHCHAGVRWSPWPTSRAPYGNPGAGLRHACAVAGGASR